MPFQEQYGNSTLDTIHNYFPALLYETNAFRTVPDVFAYVGRQMDRHFNPFSSARNNYMARHPPQPLLIPPAPRATIPIHINYNNLLETMYPSQPGVTDMLTLLTQGLQSLQPPRQNVMDPVIVRPTQQQIAESTVVESLSEQSEMCAICQDTLPTDEPVRTITFCEHSFHMGCIDTWFQQNVRCPVCRHDIRETSEAS